ncbi:MAG: hypothetical protein JO340_08050 [Acidobacteriaceae bacterium]|nr:hypothetical protein [Acidobacteriaceae bacterium]
MNGIPEILYERLAAAIDESLSASTSVQQVISEINSAGYQILLAVLVKIADSDFGGSDPNPIGNPAFDANFLGSVGIAE